MASKRVPLYDRLPDIYRVRDNEELGPRPLEAYLAVLEEVLGEVHANIEGLYHDFFIETCDEWVIPYIGDLLGVSHLSGPATTLRADVADTVALRSDKGTLRAIQRLTSNLTDWHTHAVELRENIVWSQHLNHQRPDAGGGPPYLERDVNRFTVMRGGTANVRDPATLALLETPFDVHAHFADLRKPVDGAIRYNLPNLAIFLWRLETYHVRAARPTGRDFGAVTAVGAAPFVARFDVDPLGRPVRLFNHRALTLEVEGVECPHQMADELDAHTEADAAPGPIPTARLSSQPPTGNPAAYVRVDPYEPSAPDTIDISGIGLELHIPRTAFEPFENINWTFRGANLCAWETGLGRPLVPHEVAIDPVHGRIAIGVDSAARRNALLDGLRTSYTYGAVGRVGAHPGSLPGVPTGATRIRVPEDGDLQSALGGLPSKTSPVVIEIANSQVHDLDLTSVAGIITQNGGPNLLLANSLTIRAADNERPIIRLAVPLRFRPANFAANNDGLTVRIESIFLTRGEGFGADEPLVARAALNALELNETTFDPGGDEQLDENRADMSLGMRLATEPELDQIPEIHLRRSVTGPLRIDSDFTLYIEDSIVDGGSGVGITTPGFAVSGAADPEDTAWGPEIIVRGTTFLGRLRARRLSGSGGIFVHLVEVLDDQRGCVKHSYFATQGKLPQHHACVFGAPNVRLRFTSERFGHPAYGQLARSTDFRIRERGPDDDAMGAFGFLQEAHRYRNLAIRFREFMPVGVRHLLIPIT